MTLLTELNVPADIPEDHRQAAIQLGEAMKRLHRYISSRVMHGMQTDLTELDISFSQVTALHQLRASGELTVTALSERTRLSLPAASHLVERLVQRGLAERTENPENRREKVVRLTQAGQELLSGMDSGFVRAYVETFSHLPPAKIEDTTRTLTALLDELKLNQSTCAAALPPAPLENP